MELDLPGILVRVSVMYLYALTLVRISGKESIGQLTSMDFVVTLIIGDLFDDVFWAEVPFAQGLVGFGAVVLAHMLVTFLCSRSKFVFRLVNFPARVLIEDGKLVQEGLQHEWMRQATLFSELRMKGEEHPKEIREATLEPEGQLSVLKTDARESVKKKDLRLLR